MGLRDAADRIADSRDPVVCDPGQPREAWAAKADQAARASSTPLL
ncbi:hypothetical protein AB0890_00790 [Streptomyces sp. NPDC005406]